MCISISMNPEKHNLDINKYSLIELFALFDIANPTVITEPDIKRAKKKVLMTHPDKSGLAADYFLFYKKAFDIVVKFWEIQNKQNQTITEENTKYNTKDLSKTVDKSVKKVIQDLSPQDFQKRFNKLFEENMYEKPNPEKNQWFSNEAPTYVVNETVNNKNMGAIIEKIKETQNGMVKYRGVENLSTASGKNLYDDTEEDGGYVSSDIFGKLKYDDLRKVHKDQTVFVVSERDFDKVQQYKSVDHFVKERDANTGKPMEKLEAERMLAEKNQAYREQMMKKEYVSDLRTIENISKNQAVLSNFLRLHN